MFDPSLQRSHSCGELRATHVGQVVTLNGWVRKRRDMGQLIFIDLRDRMGITQIVFDPGHPDAHAAAKELRAEFVISVKGSVRSRGDQVNTGLPTGEIELLATSLTILNKAETPPFHLDDEAETDDTRLAHRYLDLRRPHLQAALVARHEIALAVRNYLDAERFIEIETPMLTKSTPEGARDYLVPSRIHPGAFYALPQSPQLLKQLLMIAGMDRYFQIARCFRDEDLRADRQPEFTQVDVEMSFATQNDVFRVTEGFVQAAFAARNIHVHTPFPRLSYRDAMDSYGTDKPDLRFGLEIKDVTAVLKSAAFNAFKETVAAGGAVKALRVPSGATLTRKQLDELGRAASAAGAKGVLSVKYEQDGRKSSLAKYLNDAEWQALDSALGTQQGDCVLMIADALKTARAAMGAVRLALGSMLGLVAHGSFSLCWITDFPLFAWDEEEKRWVSEHHPFTAPALEDMALLESSPGSIRSCSYDLVVNGFECASGSIRIHDAAVQERVFTLLKLGKEEIDSRFGFFIEALKFGAPPHAGIAVGLDRLTMLILGRQSLRDVIAFPKTQKATDLMTGAPSPVRDDQLAELHIGTRDAPTESKP